MSYCAIITFKDGKPSEQIEYRNAWGGAARIWNSLFDKYLKNPEIPYDSWLQINRQQSLWDLANRKTLPDCERAVHCSTLDLAYIQRDNFLRFASHLREFDRINPVQRNTVNHLIAWADKIVTLECEAIGFYGTSVSENPWCKWNEEKDESDAIPLSEGWEIYDHIYQRTEQTESKQ